MLGLDGQLLNSGRTQLRSRAGEWAIAEERRPSARGHTTRKGRAARVSIQKERCPGLPVALQAYTKEIKQQPGRCSAFPTFPRAALPCGVADRLRLRLSPSLVLSSPHSTRPPQHSPVVSNRARGRAWPATTAAAGAAAEASGRMRSTYRSQVSPPLVLSLFY